MRDMRLEQAGKVLGLTKRTMLKYVGEGRFPNAYLPYGSRRLGWHVPVEDLLSYAEEQGPWLVRKVRKELAALPDDPDAEPLCGPLVIGHAS